MLLSRKTGSCIASRLTKTRADKGMTLVEVVVSLVLIALFAATAFPLVMFNQKRHLANFYRLEAYRLAQDISEHAMQVPYQSFTLANIQAASATGTATAWTWTNTEYSMFRLQPGKSSASAALTFPSGSSAVVYTKALGAPQDMSGNATAVEIQVSWKFNGTQQLKSFYVVQGKTN